MFLKFATFIVLAKTRNIRYAMKFMKWSLDILLFKKLSRVKSKLTLLIYLVFSLENKAMLSGQMKSW